MRATKTKFIRKPLAAAVMCSAIGLSPAVFGATIPGEFGSNVGVNTDNLDPVELQTFIYQDADPDTTVPDDWPTDTSVTNGWLERTTDFGSEGLGIAVYNESFSASSTNFAGCIMAQTELGPPIPDSEVPQEVAPNCLAESDSGKRFKLKATTATTLDVDAPIDIVFNAIPDAESKTYRVIGKLSNLTPELLGGFRIQLGFGLGDQFIPSSAEDGLSLGDSVGPLGRYPGGLFGGSPAEGLPFFSTDGAFFVKDDTNSDEDKVQTLEMPYPYYEIFGSWLQLDSVPQGWFYDHDGNPSNDPILLAYDDNGELLTYEKTYTDPTFDPASATFAYDLGNRDDLEAVIANLTLTQRPASEVFAADGDQVVTVDGLNYPVDAVGDWSVTPVTVIDTDSGGALVATWNTETELYDIAPAYQETYGVTLTLTEMLDISGPPDSETNNIIRQPGYVEGAIEDLANVNINASITVGGTDLWSDGACVAAQDSSIVTAGETLCTFTMRINGLSADQFDAPAPPPEEPTDPTDPIDPEDSASSSDGDGPIFGCTAGKPGSPFDPVLPGMVLMALAGLWARKRRGTA